MKSPYYDTIILKILSGIQAGVDVSLVDGTYVIGSADSADIQIFDVSLAPQHARLAVENGRISIAALSGPLQLRSGMALPPSSKAHQLRPLDVVTMGTTRIAIAPLGADWAGVCVDNDVPERARRSLYRPMSVRALWDKHRAAFVGAVAALPFLGFWIIPHSLTFLTTLGGRLTPTQEETLSEAIRTLGFAEHLKIRKANDGTIHVDGAVNTMDERQTVSEAVKHTGIPAVTHIVVIDSLRTELATAIAEKAPDGDFSIDADGTVTLTGTMSDEKGAAELLQLVKDMVGDAVPVRSSLKTYDDVLAEVIVLARRAQLSRNLHLKRNGRFIEAEGSLSPGQLDAWAGFLQSYGRQFASTLTLRSLVRLQDTDGAVEHSIQATPLYIGAEAQADGRQIDLERLAAGDYAAADLLVGGSAADKHATRPQLTEQAPRTKSPSRHELLRIDLVEFLSKGSARESPHARDLEWLAQRAIELVEKDQLEEGNALKEATADFKQSDRSTTLAEYAELLDPNRRKPPRVCWAGSSVTLRDVTGALFWLDVLTQSDALSTADFGRDIKGTLMEVALNPMKVGQCANLATDGALKS